VGVVGTLEIFQGTHILGASRGRLCDSSAFLLTDDSLQSADKDRQESRAMAGKMHDAVVKFHTYLNLQRHRAVLPAIAWLSCDISRTTYAYIRTQV